MRIIIHIGYPRTGTTWLQKRVFPYFKNINYIGAKSYGNKKLYISKLENLKMCKDIRKVSMGDYFQKNFFEKKKVNIYSSENFTHFRDKSLFIFLKKFSKYLKDTFGKDKFEILCVYREPTSFIRSLFFKKFIRSKKVYGTSNYEKHLHNILYKNDEIYKNIRKNLMFYKLYNNLKSNFKNIKLNFIRYEDMSDKPDVFSKKLAKALTINEAKIKKLLAFKDNANIYKDGKIYKNSKSMVFIKKKLNFIKPFVPTFFKRNKTIFLSGTSINEKKILQLEKKIEIIYKNQYRKLFSKSI